MLRQHLRCVGVCLGLPDDPEPGPLQPEVDATDPTEEGAHGGDIFGDLSRVRIVHSTTSARLIVTPHGPSVKRFPTS